MSSFTQDSLHAFKREANRGRCLHFDADSRCKEIVSAHSIQRRGQLSFIEEDGHVYRLTPDLASLHRSGGILKPERTGWKKASTFAGFCKTHDNKLFQPIDDSALVPTSQQITLYAYRCLCREFFVKENAVRVLERLKEHSDLDSSQTARLRASLTGHALGLTGLIHHKQYYDCALRAQKYSEFDYVALMSQSRWSLQLSGNLYPDFGFDGQRLQDLGDLSLPLDLITFFTAPTTEGWAFVFAWHKSSSATGVAFIKSLGTQAETGATLANALLRFSFSCCENHAFRMSWWDSLPDVAKAKILDRVFLMASPFAPVAANYLTEGCEDVADWTFGSFTTSLSE